MQCERRAAQLLVGPPLPEFIQGALAGLEVKEGSWQFMAFIVVSQTLGDGGTWAGGLKSLMRTMWPIEESQKKLQEI